MKRTMQRWTLCTLIMLITLAVGFSITPIYGQTGVVAEAIGQANLRSGPSIEYAIVLQIQAGTPYPVIGRSALYPWLLLSTPMGQGWVYIDLVKVTGDLNTVPYSELIVGVATSLPTNPPTAVTAEPANNATGTPTPANLVTPTIAALAYIEAQGTLNVRYGPGVDFPRIGEISQGTRYPVTQRHTQFEWVEIILNPATGLRGWVYLPAVTVTGDLNAVPATNITNFAYPSLTPTLPMVVTGVPPWTAEAPTTPDQRLEQVANQIYNLLLANKFEPHTQQQGSVFLMDLNTGQTFNINPNVAYSGMSLIKIPVMVTFFRKLNTRLTIQEAQTLAEMAVCSENLSSNAILRSIGGGNEYRGAEAVTDTMRTFGLTHTFLVGPFFVGDALGIPTPIPEPVHTITTDADQVSTDPDALNQATPADLGYLLAGIYQCALDGSGPLTSAFPNEITQQECRQMVRVMRSNHVSALIGAGLPTNVALARKYGWVDEVHGDEALITTNGGDYVLVVMLRNKGWLEYDSSFPLIGEISRLVYNYYNPQVSVAQINAEPVPTCSLNTIDASLFTDLQLATLPAIR